MVTPNKFIRCSDGLSALRFAATAHAQVDRGGLGQGGSDEDALTNLKTVCHAETLCSRGMLRGVVDEREVQ